jgi:hypothetical protein
MIEVFNSLDILDILYDSSEKNNCVYVYFTNTKLDLCEDSELKKRVYEYYEEFLPEDLTLIIKTGKDNIIKFSTSDSAIINAKSWFPTREQLGDLSDEYYFHCRVVDADSVIYEN